MPIRFPSNRTHFARIFAFAVACSYSGVGHTQEADSDDLLSGPVIPAKTSEDKPADKVEVAPPAPTAPVAPATPVAVAPVPTEPAKTVEAKDEIKLEPAIELLKLREENGLLREQILRTDAEIAERDIKIGDLQDEIARINDEKAAVTSDLERTKQENAEAMQELQARTNVLEQSVQQYERSALAESERQMNRKNRYNGIVNRYKEANVEFIPTMISN